MKKHAHSISFVYVVLGPMRTKSEEFENAASLRLGLSSTLIRHENGVFQNALERRRNL